MHMRRTKYIIICVVLLLILLLATGCGSEVSLGASMSGLNETEETTDISDEDVESEDIEEEEYDYEFADEEAEQTEQIEENQADDSGDVHVVLNTNPDRKRIHIPGTSCAGQIKEENYLDWTGTEEELVKYAEENGYVACGRCHPDTKLGIELPKP